MAVLAVVGFPNRPILS